MMRAVGRAGEELDDMEYILRFSDPSYQVLSHTKVGSHLVSTVWLGTPHGQDAEGRVLVFETMTFAQSGSSAGQRLSCRRYASEADAFAGHEEEVARTRMRVLAELDTLEFGAVAGEDH